MNRRLELGFGSWTDPAQEKQIVPHHVCFRELFENSLRNHLDLETIEGLAMALNKFEARPALIFQVRTSKVATFGRCTQSSRILVACIKHVDLLPQRDVPGRCSAGEP